jgi:hypothetical protein
MRKQRFLALTAVLVGIGFLTTARIAAADDDPPGRVARLNFHEGSVSFQPAGESDWISVVPNRPLVTGDRLWADANSRAEVHVGSTSIRMSGETGMAFLELTDNVLQIQLSQGTIIVRVRHLDDENMVEVDTPNLAFVIQRNGEYRFDANSDDDETVATVYKGRGQVTGGGRNFTVVGGQRAIFSGTDELNYAVGQIPSPDDFEEWVFSRDHREDSAETTNYISPEMTGYEDLDDYGRWQYAGSYGPVWVPVRVPAGWAPYRFGHWVWIWPWGWTWVDDQPWGFAPFHYGRWAYWGAGWVWVPGPVYVRPVYAPALVAWVGGGGGFGLAISVGGGFGVGWLALAPGEVFVPGYRCSRTYVNNVNITNTTVNVTKVTNVYNYYTTNNTKNITKITYVNQQAPNGVTAVSKETFVNARPVSKNVVEVPLQALANAKPGRLQEVQPVKQSVIGAGAPTGSKPPAGTFGKGVVATRMPTQPQGSVAAKSNVPPAQTAPQQTGRNDKQLHAESAPPSGRGQGQNPPPSKPSADQETQRNTQQPYGQSAPPPGRGQNQNPSPFKPPPAKENQRNNQQAGESSPSRHGQNNPPPFKPPVKLAPPVQPKSPQQAQEEEQKFRNWQEQRPKPQNQPSRPPQEERPQARPPENPPPESHPPANRPPEKPPKPPA